MNPSPHPRLFLPLTRRQVTRLALSGAIGTLLMPTQAQAQTSAVPSATPSTEGELLIAAVPANVGYALTATQAAEVHKQLATYPGAFSKVRAFQLPDDVGPAFAALAPPVPARRPEKGRTR